MNERDAQRLAKIDEKMEQMKAQKKDIVARNNKRQRQERTRRLIQIGAMTEKYFDIKDIQPNDYENFLQVFFKINNIKECVMHTKQHILHANTKGASIPQHEQRVDTESTSSEPSGISN